MTFEACVLETPLRPFTLLARDGCVVAAGFASPDEIAPRLLAKAADKAVLKRDLGPLSRAVVDYFDGNVSALEDVPVEQPGGPFHAQVWAALRSITPGESLTYGALAAKAGRPRAARAAGTACARNLVAVIVPCHRAVSSREGIPLEGRLNNYYYGLEIKRWLLEHERRFAGC